ncbi:hypothetical protein MKW98_004142 [Papaver atlanticum]|uniref:Uncharacterized protein n=1 Tax=Papaver atlanticum TaxID=357466 RepID=A0AAD4T2D5_9MAGN|nr:hypothetical protein MKW98_004142 [Papaver atlanticum]
MMALGQKGQRRPNRYKQTPVQSKGVATLYVAAGRIANKDMAQDLLVDFMDSSCQRESLLELCILLLCHFCIVEFSL